MRLENTITLPGILPLKKEVLGNEFKIIVGERHGTIAFPLLPDNYKDFFNWDYSTNYTPNKNLLTPNNAKIIINPNNETEWGYVYSSTGDASVKKCQIWFPIDKDVNKMEIANDLAIRIPHWINRFILFLEIIKQNIYSLTENDITKENTQTQLWLIDEKGHLTSPSNLPIQFTFQIPDNEFAINKETIQKAINYCNQNELPNMARTLLRDANSHLLKAEYRRTVLDASSALEMALTNVIYSKLKNEITTSNLIDVILKKHENLSGRIDLCKILGIKLSFTKHQYMTDIGIIRNMAIHSGYKSNETEARKAYQISQTTILSLCSDIEKK